MRRIFFYFITLFCTVTATYAATRDAQLTNTTGYNYNYMYPYMNNQMRTNLNPGVTTSQSLNPINTVVRTTKLSPGRRVVPRPAPANRTASNTTNRRTNTNIARSGTMTPQSAQTAPARRVVARPGLSRNAVTARGTTRKNKYNTTYSETNSGYRSSEIEPASSAHCLADYTNCMNNYCLRKDTAYNRCYCSSKLSQIDAKYQPAIESLINQILTIKNTTEWSDTEMNEYWMNSVGKYFGDSSWTNIDNALNKINWSDLESRVRGQNAFVTGNEYCTQYLERCAYMITNLRDAYRSEISRDCSTYEQSLQKIKNAAESIVESYK